MTRLNSTFRPSCKIENRITTKGERNAIQVRYARKDIRVASFRDKLVLDLYKDKIRAEKLLQTTLDARQQIRKTGRDFRVLDVAGDISMDEDLQVKLLSTKEKDKIILETNIAVCEALHDTAISSTSNEQNVDFSLQLSSDKDSRDLSKRCKRNHSKLRNGDSRIEAFATVSEQHNGKLRTSEKIARPSRFEADSDKLGEYFDKSEANRPNEALLDRHGLTLNAIGGVNSSDYPLLNNSAFYSKNGVKHLGSSFDSQPISHCSVKESTSASVNGSFLHESVLKSVSNKKSLKIENQHEHNYDSQKDKVVDSLPSKETLEMKYTKMDNECEETYDYVCNCSCNKLKKSLLNSASRDFGDQNRLNHSVLNKGAYHEMRKRQDKRIPGNKKTQTREIENKNLEKRKQGEYIIEKSFSTRTRKRKGQSWMKTAELQNKVSEDCLKNNRTKKIDANLKVDEKSCKKDVLKDNKGATEVDVEEVLGVKISQDGVCKVLVQFKDGTSNWIDKLQLDSFQEHLVNYFTFPYQDLAVIHRPSFAIYEIDKSQSTDSNIPMKKCEEKEIIEKCFPVSSTEISPVRSYHERKETTDEIKDERQFFSISPTRQDSCSKQICSIETKSNTFTRDADLSPGAEQVTVNGIAPLGYKNWDRLESKDNSLDDNEAIKDEKSCLDTSLTSDKIYVSKNGELEVIESEFIQIVLRHKDRRSKRINVDTCDNLIQQLELRSTDERFSLVVIYGLEEYFASTMDMEKIMKVPAHGESTRHDEKITSLRYLFQTLKNYPKPTVAIVNSAATGLAAAVLTLVDVVYDEAMGNKAEKNGLMSHKTKLHVLLPKLMGLLPKNEALLMGDTPDTTSLEEQLQKVGSLYSEYKFSHGLKETLKEMKKNEWLSSNKPVPRKRGRPATPKKNVVPLNSSSNGKDAKISRHFSASNDSKINKIEKELEDEIRREKEMSVSCLLELADFWNELSEAMIYE